MITFIFYLQRWYTILYWLQEYNIMIQLLYTCEKTVYKERNGCDKSNGEDNKHVLFISIYVSE